MAVVILSLVIICCCFFLLYKMHWIWTVNQARRRGIYPLKNKATIFDVRNLIFYGENELAVRVYRKIFKASRKQAVKDINELSQSIHNRRSVNGL